jgi:lysophospholipase L1-like esterase
VLATLWWNIGASAARGGLSDDDLYPNAKGYQVMALLAEAAVARALGTER